MVISGLMHAVMIDVDSDRLSCFCNVSPKMVIVIACVQSKLNVCISIIWITIICCLFIRAHLAITQSTNHQNV